MKIIFDDDKGIIEMIRGKWEATKKSKYSVLAAEFANMYMHKEEFRNGPDSPMGLRNLAKRVIEVFGGELKAPEYKLDERFIY